MNDSDVTVFICVTCKALEPDAESPGRIMLASVAAGLRGRLDCNVVAAAVECLSVCKRPCTVALTARSKWTYVIGDLDPLLHADDVIAASLQYAATEDGIIPWRERPQSFRKGVVSRVPPLNFRPDEAARRS